MPASAVSRAALSHPAVLARPAASAPAPPAVTARVRPSSAVALAISPARWPPMPSATAKSSSRRSTRYESSLPSRTWPVSVDAPETILIRRSRPAAGCDRSLDQLHHGLAELHAVAGAQPDRLDHRLAVEQRAVRGSEVLDVGVVAAHEDACVDRGHERVVVEHHRAAGTTPDAQLLAQRERLPGAVRRVDDDQLPPLAAALAARRRHRRDRCRVRGRDRGDGDPAGPELAEDRAHDAEQEQVDEREEAVLEDRERAGVHELAPTTPRTGSRRPRCRSGRRRPAGARTPWRRSRWCR